MRCTHARCLMMRKASQDLEPREAVLLAKHLNDCPACSKLDDELDRTWDALALCAEIDPSPESLPRLMARLRLEEQAPRSPWLGHLNRRWQWVALAGCLVVAAVLLSRTDPWHRALPSSGAHAVATNGDHADEQFLRKLDETLQQSAADYLSTYDTWPSVVRETAKPEVPDSKPATPSAKKDRL